MWRPFEGPLELDEEDGPATEGVMTLVSLFTPFVPLGMVPPFKPMFVLL